MQGKVKFFNTSKGFGFITGDDGQDYFVHRSQVPEGVVLQENDDVSFDPAETERGKQAQNVAVGAGESAPAEEAAEEPAEETEEAPTEEEAPAEEASEDSEEEKKQEE